MNLEQHLHQLDALEASFQAVIKRMHSLQQQVQHLERQNQELRKNLEQKNEDVKNFQNRENITKIVHSMAATDAGNTAELKWKINEYIREIDKCIGHLKA